jgi:hypothetical protein
MYPGFVSRNKRKGTAVSYRSHMDVGGMRSVRRGPEENENHALGTDSG